MSNDQDIKLTTIRVKSVNSNGSVYLLKMKYTDTIQNLKDHIKSQR